MEFKSVDIATRRTAVRVNPYDASFRNVRGGREKRGKVSRPFAETTLKHNACVTRFGLDFNFDSD
jgi:hypothetical protein